MTSFAPGLTPEELAALEAQMAQSQMQPGGMTEQPQPSMMNTRMPGIEGPQGEAPAGPNLLAALTGAGQAARPAAAAPTDDMYKRSYRDRWWNGAFTQEGPETYDLGGVKEYNNSLQDGVVTQSIQRPDIPKDENGRPTVKGRWNYIGNSDQFGMGTGGSSPLGDNSGGGQSGPTSAWVFEAEEKASVPAKFEEEPKKPKERFPEGDIYNDWDYYTKRARADVEGINRMPFTFNDYPNVEKDKNDAFQQFYPAAWQTGGVQKIVGPNGSNIAPMLDSNLLSLFRDGGIDPSTAKDWPSLIDALTNSGKIDASQRKTLEGFTKQKKPDTSFANQGMAMAAMAK